MVCSRPGAGPRRVLSGGAVLAFGGCNAEVVTTGERQKVPLSRSVRFGEMLGVSVAMHALFARLERLAGDDQSVLLVGESGKGKELIARGLHAEGASTRSETSRSSFSRSCCGRWRGERCGGSARRRSAAWTSVSSLRRTGTCAP